MQSQPLDVWKIRAEKIDPAHYYGITVGNGMIGIVSSSIPLEVKDVVLAGVYDLYGRGRVSNFLKSFQVLNAYLQIDQKRIENKNISNLRQELDMRQASFTTTFDFGTKASVSASYYALRHLPFNVLLDMRVTAHEDIEMEAASVIEAPDSLKDVQNHYQEIDRPHVSIPLLTSSAKSPTGKWLLCASTSFLFEEEHGKTPKVVHEIWDSGKHLMKFARKLAKGQTYSFAIVGSSITSAHHDDPLNEADRLTIFSRLEGRERLLSFHQRAWEKLWESDIVIEGDDEAQRDVRSMLYHLYSFCRENTALSLSPMGLSGLGYNGHVFWDTEIWMFPALLLLQPAMAKSLMEYRFRRLDAAKRNAFAHGYEGAMFPWESAATGVEETPVWALSGPFEQHITACVGIAAWNYYCVTQDRDWLKEKGFPILKETADFWVSRVEKNAGGKYEIKNVVAADEWAENVDNNAWTNAAAKAVLQHATEAAQHLALKPNPVWQDVAQNIVILKFPDGVTKEHASYQGENIKQADVNLLAYPLSEVSLPEEIQKDLSYYEKRVPDEGTPAMTSAIFALLYARLGDGTKAYHWFTDAYKPNLNPPFRVIAETKKGTNPYFITGAGGVLQTVLMGFGGLSITAQGIVQKYESALPLHWKSLTLQGIGPEKKTIRIERKNEEK